MSRADNSVKNIITSGIYQVLLIVLNFLVRLVFIKTLGKAYLGINGLYYNILMVLSLADMGIDGAVLYKLYRPVEVQDKARITAWMHLFRKLYIAIGSVIFLIGVCLLPFLPYIIRDYEQVVQLGLNPVLILLIYVFQSASTYWFFTYKRVVVDAHQKTYLLSVRTYVLSVVSAVCQILVLLFWNNFLVSTFIMYLAVIIAFQILQNYIFARAADKYYPYINDRSPVKVSGEELRDVLRDCGSLFLLRSGNAIVSATDNIALSVICGLSTVGYYSNYQLIYLNIRQLLTEVINSLGASIGSIGATDNPEWKYNIFVTVNLATVFLFGCISVPLAVLGDEFVRLWLADEQYVLDTLMLAGREVSVSISYLIGIELYLYGQLLYLEKFRNSFGLFRQKKIRPVLMALINLALTVLLVPSMGASGCVISTIVAYASTVIIIDPIVILDKELHTSKRAYFLRNAAYSLVTLFSGVCAVWACGKLPGHSIPMFILRGVIAVGLTGVLYLICFGRTEAMKMLMSFLPQNSAVSLLCRILRIPWSK